jgi:hypothetical protein
MTRLDRVLRWVWLIIGVLLLVLLVSSLVFVASEALSGGGGGSAARADTARTDSAGRARGAEPLRYDPPSAIRGSATRIVLIRRGSGYTYRSTASSAPATGEAPAVNVAFLAGDGARLLLDRPAYVRRVAYPGAARVAEGDSLRWIAYEMALEDTDGNGRVDESDRRSLYVTDLDGRGLRRVTPPGYELRDWAPQPGGAIVATAVQLAPGSGAMAERAYVLDAGGAVKTYAALDSVVDAAGRIVAKP